MAEFDVATYLAAKGYRGKKGSGPELVYPCFMDCGESPESNKRKLYLNTDTGYYTCFVCGASGGTYLLQQHFGDTPAKPEPGSDPDTRRRILNWAADVGSAMLTNNDDVLMYLLERGLSAETIVENKIGFVGNHWSLVGSLPEQFTSKELANTGLVHKEGPRAGQDFFASHILIPYLSRGNVMEIRGRQWGGAGKAKYMTGPGDPVLLYGVDDFDGADDVIITEGEFDRLVLKQELATASDDRARRMAVVGLAGANGFKESFDVYLNSAKRIYLALDPDDTGGREMVKLKERFGSRARIVELPSELPKCDWTEYLLPVPVDADREWHIIHPHAGHTWRDVLALLGNATGKRLFTMREAGASFRTSRATIGHIKTGYSQLDAVIGGMGPGQLCVVLAKTGTGKTIFCVNLAWNMRHIPQIFVSLEMTREEIYERLRKVAHFYHPWWSDDEVETALENILICDENRLSEKDLETLIEEFEMERGVRPVVAFVDYLGYFARGVRGTGPYEKTTNACMQLKAMAKAGKLLLITPSQVNRGANEGKPISLDDARDSGAVEETSDFLLSLYRPDEALTPETGRQPSGVMKLEVLKSRQGGKGTVLNFQFDLMHLVIVETSATSVTSNDTRKAKDHNDMLWKGWSYERLRADETKPLQRSMPYVES